MATEEAAWGAAEGTPSYDNVHGVGAGGADAGDGPEFGAEHLVADGGNAIAAHDASGVPMPSNARLAPLEAAPVLPAQKWYRYVATMWPHQLLWCPLIRCLPSFFSACAKAALSSPILTQSRLVYVLQHL